MSVKTVDNPKIVSRAEWLVARKQLLAREKKLTREGDAVTAERRHLPWAKSKAASSIAGPRSK
jgi:predicted dithiol-disulfide oxidoreductase (DUF899 family)